MSFKPLHDNVLVEKDKVEEKKSPAGIIMTAAGQETPDTGVVLAVGAGRRLSNGDTLVPDLKVGDRVVVAKYAGTEVTVDEEKYTVIPWGDILGIVDAD